MHTTGEIQTKLHRACAKIAQPVGSRRRQIERNYVGVAERAAHDIFCRQLIILTLETHKATSALLVQGRRLDRDTTIHECFADALEVCLADLLRCAGTGNLNRRVIRIEVGSRVNKGDREHCQNQQVFPERESIEHDAARLMNAGRLARPVDIE